MHRSMLTPKSLKKLRSSNLFHILQNSVSTWSPLGAAFNTLPKQNPIMPLSRKSAGLFGIDQLTSYEGFYILKEQACAKADALTREALSPDRSRKMVDVFDELSDSLCQVADLAECVRNAHPSGDFRFAAEEVTSHIHGIVERLNTNRELYDNLKNVTINGDKFPTTDVDKNVTDLFLFDFEQSGIHLAEKERRRVVMLNDSILNLGQSFMMNVSKPKVISSDVVPQNIKQFFTTYANTVTINNLYFDSANEIAREFAYKVYIYPDSHQEYLLDQLLNCRHELATICGFETYAQRAVKSTIADTPDFINKFLSVLNEHLKPKARNDLYLMEKLKNSTNSVSKRIQPWDISYFTNLVKKSYLDSDINELSSYFSLGACMEGLNNLTEKLFGISLVYEDMTNEESWAPEIYKLAAIHEKEGLLGHIYCDFYRREDKPDQDCHFTIRGGKELPDGTYQNPIVVLILGLEKPRWSAPCLLTPGQVDNLAHEMGHALHSMLARTKHQHVSGTRCDTDFAEVPSILMEYFLSDPRVLKTFTKHYQTKEPMNDAMIQKLCRAKHSLSALETQFQVLYSALDQKLHGVQPLGKSTTEVFSEIQQEFFVLKPVPNTAWQLRFIHLVGYGAKYYSYLLSRSVASCIWQTYFKQDPFSREQGEKYRYECLRHGGGKPPRSMINDYLNKEVTPEIIAETLVSEIEEHQILSSKI